MKQVSKETRDKMSVAAKNRCTEQWRRNLRERQETKLDTAEIKRLYDLGLTQSEIGAVLGVTQKVIWRHMKNYGIVTRTAKKRFQRGSVNHMWKGDNASYKAFHQRLKKAFGKARKHKCSICGTNDQTLSYDWANLTGRYYDLLDYAPMCRSCHRKYDKGKVVMPNAK